MTRLAASASFKPEYVHKVDEEHKTHGNGEQSDDHPGHTVRPDILIFREPFPDANKSQSGTDQNAAECQDQISIEVHESGPHVRLGNQAARRNTMSRLMPVFDLVVLFVLHFAEGGWRLAPSARRDTGCDAFGASFHCQPVFRT